MLFVDTDKFCQEKSGQNTRETQDEDKGCSSK